MLAGSISWLFVLENDKLFQGKLLKDSNFSTTRRTFGELQEATTLPTDLVQFDQRAKSSNKDPFWCVMGL